MPVIKTSLGNIIIDLFENEAPETVKNFLHYVDDKHYNNTIFHRVIDGFMIQGGGFDTSFRQLPSMKPIINEAGNGLRNECGTIAMARTAEVNSATCQFFINTADNHFLDHRDDTPEGFGYCVFGRVTDGMDVVEKIQKSPTGKRGFHENVPVENILILEITRE